MKRNVLKLAIVLVALAGVSAFAADTAVQAAPDWFGPVVGFAFQLPYIGPFLKSVVPYVGLITTIFTALTVCFTTSAGALKGIAKAAGFVALAEQIQGFHDRILPYLAFLAPGNAPNPPPVQSLLNRMNKKA